LKSGLDGSGSEQLVGRAPERGQQNLVTYTYAFNYAILPK